MADIFHNLRFQKGKLRQLVSKNFSRRDQEKILEALAFADAKHRRQRRDEGTAYIIHPVRVAMILIEDVGTWDGDVVVAALLHDVVEDCGVRPAVIQKKFGRRVAHFVKALTNPRNYGESEAEKEKRKKQKLSALVRAPLEVRLIKCADILDNLRSAADVPFWAWTPIARKKFPRWRREFYFAADFAKGVHPVLYGKIVKALRTFEVKRVMRGLVRFAV